MEVGCYVLELTCDNENPYHISGEFPHKFTAANGGYAREQARDNGWKFHKDGTLSCPKCRIRKIRRKFGRKAGDKL